MPDPISPPAPTPAQTSPISEVRYSLTTMLREIDQERRESSFSMETLDQVEIQKMFANRRRRNVRPKK
jgi:hypothetical protein